MTTTIRPRVEAGVPAGGEFKAYGHSDAVPTLGAPAAPAGLDLEAVLAHASSSIGPGVVPGMEEQYESVTTGAGRDLLLQKWDARYNRETPGYRNYADYDLTPERCDQLAVLGYTRLDQFMEDKTSRFGGIAFVTSNKVTPDRLEVLGRVTLPAHRWSAWETEALLTADVEDLDALFQTEIPTAEEKYLATVALLGPEKYARAKEALAGGLRFHEKGLIESDEDPSTLARLRNALPDSKRGAWHIVGLAKKGITGDHLKAYGSKACDQFTGPELDASNIKPAVLKSLLASGVRGDLAYFRKLSNAGFTKGVDLKDASQAMETTDANILIRARRHATGEQMALFRSATRKTITPDDAKAIGRLAKAGITNPDQVRERMRGYHPAANRYEDRDVSVLVLHADVVEAGIAPERLNAMSRAGIPITEAVRLKDAPDLWAAGKPFRDVYEATEQRRFEQHWTREVTPWAFTEDTYRDAPAE